MNISAPKEIIQQTTECSKGFACLSADKRNVCKIALDICHNKLLLESNEINEIVDCPYKSSLGPFDYCLCPLRFELHIRHHI